MILMSWDRIRTTLKLARHPPSILQDVGEFAKLFAIEERKTDDEAGRTMALVKYCASRFYARNTGDRFSNLPSASRAHTCITQQPFGWRGGQQTVLSDARVKRKTEQTVMCFKRRSCAIRRWSQRDDVKRPHHWIETTSLTAARSLRTNEFVPENVRVEP